jgi:hypothetical protein
MADTAAHLVDRVLPRAPYRQWVFTVPKPLRLVMAHEPAWTSWIGGLVVRAIGAWQRRVVRKRGIRSPLTGAVTFVQRFGGLVNRATDRGMDGKSCGRVCLQDDVEHGLERREALCS